MSGKPNPEGVRQLRQHLRDVRMYRDRVDEAMKDLDQAETSLKNYREALRTAELRVKEKLEEMDVHAPGNWGYDARKFELLLMLVGGDFS